MTSRSEIKIIHSSKLDKEKWDACIESDNRALIYARSWFMDIAAEDWFGLIVEDYQAVLPLPVKRKFGLRFIAMPPFVQQLNLAGKYDAPILKIIAKKLLRFSSLIQCATPTLLFSSMPSQKRRNYILSLEDDYKTIHDAYTPACKKNISKAVRRGCRMAKDVSAEDVIRLYRDAYSDRSAYRDGHFQRMRKLLIATEKNGRSQLSGVRDAMGTLVYAAALLDDGKRLYYILGAPNEKGREMRATYFFLDSIFRSFSGKRKIFDFEGSDIPAVATFYQSFSPQAEHYFQFYINNYPFPLNKIVDSRLKP